MSYKRKEHYVQTAGIIRGEPVDAEIIDLVQNYGLTMAEINELLARDFSYDAMRRLTMQYRQQFH